METSVAAVAPQVAERRQAGQQQHSQPAHRRVRLHERHGHLVLHVRHVHVPHVHHVLVHVREPQAPVAANLEQQAPQQQPVASQHSLV